MSLSGIMVSRSREGEGRRKPLWGVEPFSAASDTGVRGSMVLYRCNGTTQHVG